MTKRSAEMATDKDSQNQEIAEEVAPESTPVTPSEEQPEAVEEAPEEAEAESVADEVTLKWKALSRKNEAEKKEALSQLAALREESEALLKNADKEINSYRQKEHLRSLSKTYNLSEEAATFLEGIPEDQLEVRAKQLQTLTAATNPTGTPEGQTPTGIIPSQGYRPDAGITQAYSKSQLAKAFRGLR